MFLWYSIIPSQNKVCLSVCSSLLLCFSGVLPISCFSLLSFFCIAVTSRVPSTVPVSSCLLFVDLKAPGFCMFEFMLLEVSQVSWICRFMYFFKFGEFSGNTFANIFLPPFLSPPVELQLHMRQTLWYHPQSHWDCSLGCFIFFCPLRYVVYFHFHWYGLWIWTFLWSLL